MLREADLSIRHVHFIKRHIADLGRIREGGKEVTGTKSIKSMIESLHIIKQKLLSFSFIFQNQSLG